MSQPSQLARIEEIVASNFLHVDVQQFVANQISALRILQHCAGGMIALPMVRHAYEYRPPDDGDSPATVDMLRQAIAQASAASGIGFNAIVATIEERAQQFAGIRHLVRDRQIVAPDFPERAIVRAVAEFRPRCGSLHEPWREEQLREVLESEGLELADNVEIPLLSACVTYRSADDTRERYRIYLQPGLQPELRALLLAHELGHWWLHLNRGRDPEGAPRDKEEFYLHSGHDWGRLEREADIFATVVLFPTPYLLWCDLENRLTPEAICADFHSTPEAAHSRSRQRLQEHLKQRLRVFAHEKEFLLGQQKLRLPEGPLSERLLEPLNAVMNEYGVAWSTTDAEYRITDCGQAFADYFAMSRDTLLAENLHVVEQLTPAPLRKRLLRQLQHKRRRRVATLFVTDYADPRTDKSTTVLINAFAIVDNSGQYVGSLGIASPYPDGVSETNRANATGDSRPSTESTTREHAESSPGLPPSHRKVDAVDLESLIRSLDRRLANIERQLEVDAMDEPDGYNTIHFTQLDRRQDAYACLDRHRVVYELLMFACVQLEQRGIDILRREGFGDAFEEVDYAIFDSDDEHARRVKAKHIKALESRYGLTS